MHHSQKIGSQYVTIDRRILRFFNTIHGQISLLVLIRSTDKFCDVFLLHIDGLYTFHFSHKNYKIVLPQTNGENYDF